MADQSALHQSRRKNRILINMLVILGIVIFLYIIGGTRRFESPLRDANRGAELNLRNLAHSQDVYRKDNGTYANSLEKLDYKLDDKVTAYILSVDNKHCSMFAFHYKGTEIYFIDRPEGEIRVYKLSHIGPSFWHRLLSD